jgi:pyridoxine 5-phosphate synthase
MPMATLGFNVDHIATLRQARGGKEPNPVHAAILAELSGSRGITAHLREDRRHIQDHDIQILKQTLSIPFNLEMACSAEMIKIAVDLLPAMVTLVPEKRDEKTTEGGLSVYGHEKELGPSVEILLKHNIAVSMFIAPDFNQIKASKKTGAAFVEFHTGFYANAHTDIMRSEELEKLRAMAYTANKFGLRVNAGHGLNYQNAAAIAAIEFIEELNIGHAIIARAVFVGIEAAIRDMVSLIS